MRYVLMITVLLCMSVSVLVAAQDHGAHGEATAVGETPQSASGHEHEQHNPHQHEAQHEALHTPSAENATTDHNHAAMPTTNTHEEHETPHTSDTHAHAGHGAQQDAAAELSGGIRDPHEYSGGYERNTGPYSMPVGEHMGMAGEATFFGLWVDRFETRQGDAEDFQEFAGYAWMGNSYQKWVLKSELEWRNSSIEESATELLYTRAVSPFWDLQIGGRVDHGDFAHRKWFAVGMKGLAPYWFEVDATAYIGPSGHSAAHLEVEYDLLLGQRLFLQPKVGLDFYGDSDLEAGHGKGLSKSKMGVRLRYEINRQLAPYIGYERIHHHGEAADIFRVFNQHRENQWLAGVHFWF